MTNDGGIKWAIPEGVDIIFSGEGEWKITLDVLCDLGLAFAGAIIGIYVLLITQTSSFRIPIIIMLAIPLTIWLLYSNKLWHGLPYPNRLMGNMDNKKALRFRRAFNF